MTSTPAPRFRIRRRAVSALDALFGADRYTVEQSVRKTLLTSGWTEITSTRTLRGAHRIVARHRGAGVVWEDPAPAAATETDTGTDPTRGDA